MKRTERKFGVGAAVLCAVLATVLSGCARGGGSGSSSQTQGSSSNAETNSSEVSSVNTETNSSNTPPANAGTISSDGRSSVDTAEITVEVAKSAAVKHAGLAESEVTFTEVKLDYDDGIAEYDVEFVTDFMKYEYEIKAADGTVMKFFSEKIERSAVPAELMIGEDRAKELALEHAGLTEDEVTFTEVKFDHDDGVAVYEVEFKVGGSEYEFKISAADGTVLEMDRDDR